eukprot:2050686-Prymnesium_polylepis.2
MFATNRRLLRPKHQDPRDAQQLDPQAAAGVAHPGCLAVRQDCWDYRGVGCTHIKSNCTAR